MGKQEGQTDGRLVGRRDKATGAEENRDLAKATAAAEPMAAPRIAVVALCRGTVCGRP